MFPNSDNYIGSGVRSEGKYTGKAKKVLAQLAAKNLSVSKNSLKMVNTMVVVSKET